MKNKHSTSARGALIRRRAIGDMSLAFTLMLAACGGSGTEGGAPFGSGSGSNTGAASGTGAGTSASGSSGANSAGSGTPSRGGGAAPALAGQISVLEQSGGYPKLDRSADIAGPDANGNGVRDDIEAWINSLKLGDAQTRALMQDAQATQRTLLVSLDDKAALQGTGEGLAASSQCGMLQFPEYSDFSKLAGKIEAMTANTRQRAERYMKYNAARSGSSTRSPDGDTCEK